MNDPRCTLFDQFLKGRVYLKAVTPRPRSGTARLAYAITCRRLQVIYRGIQKSGASLALYDRPLGHTSMRQTAI